MNFFHIVIVNWLIEVLIVRWLGTPLLFLLGMRTLKRIDSELGHVVGSINESDLSISGEVELGKCDSIVVHDSTYSEIYVTESLTQGDRCIIRIKKTFDGDKAKYLFKLPDKAVGCIYIVRSFRAYKYILG